MTHHLDAVNIRSDHRLNLTDMYVFDSPRAGHTVLVLCAGPDAGKSSPLNWNPQAAYDIHLDPLAGDPAAAAESVRIRVLPGPVDGEGQPVEVRLLRGTDLPRPVDSTREQGDLVGTGRTGETFALNGTGAGGRGWFGPASDPFAADVGGYIGLLTAAATGQAPDFAAYGASPNFFDGRNVMAVVLEVPDSVLPAGKVGVWASVTVFEAGEVKQVSRWGLPDVNPQILRGDEEVDEINAGHPSDDADRWRERAAQRVATAVRGAGTAADPDAYGRWVAQRWFPQVLPYTVGTPAQFGPYTVNGRALHDDVNDHAVSLYFNRPLDDGVRPDPGSGEFPYLRPAAVNDLPAIVG